MKESLSVLLSCHLSWFFLGIEHLDFYKFRHGAKNPYEVVCDRANFLEKLLPQKLGKWVKNSVNLKKNLVINFYWICSLMKICIICCVISYSWEKSCSWDIGQNILSQSSCRFFKSSIYQWDLFAYWCKFTKVQSCWIIFLVGHGQNISVANLVSGL